MARIHRTVIACVALELELLAAPACAQDAYTLKGAWAEVPFTWELGLPAAEFENPFTQRKIRVVLDSGSKRNLISPDACPEPVRCSVRIGKAIVALNPSATTPFDIPLFKEFNRVLPEGKRVDGILGQSFFSSFRVVIWDNNRRVIVLLK